ncbi:MAG TPA: hypothetical protein PL048_21690 [Leptospiraceae bacterium]|nr:hypothetical protein [Leptospiraceae bacterium]HMZ61401.1 hypothetical protein [Leptospiraceae bacterium]HNF13130.1 hypothetical protein [Leptospiraceae bacterium]HNF23563.1 hypothetical protein [Leptospiraceae bacterium]HNH10462.1 hypothetical protein [Leptospiraceae bacterium]
MTEEAQRHTQAIIIIRKEKKHPGSPIRRRNRKEMKYSSLATLFRKFMIPRIRVISRCRPRKTIEASQEPSVIIWFILWKNLHRKAVTII